MKRFIIIMIAFCLTTVSCVSVNNTLTYVEDEVSIEQWIKSANAKKGYIFISGQLTPITSSNVVKKMLELNNHEDVERIRLIINTNGGEANAYRSIVNVMRTSPKPVDVINIGSCYSAGVGIFAAASGKRYAFPKTHFMIHRPSSNEWEAGVRDGINYEMKIYESTLRQNTDLPADWFPLSDRLIFFSAEEAKKYRLVDEIISELP